MDELINQIDKFIRTMANNPYFGMIGFLIGLISLIYAFYIAKRDRKIKNLSFSTVNSNFISEKQKVYPKLSISYDGNVLENFTISKVRINNNGSEVIKLEDIAKTDPIRIIINPEEAKLLEFSVFRTKDPNNNFRLDKIDDHTIGVEFDYIEPGDSVIIQVLHTGKEDNSIHILGTVIGAYTSFASSRSKSLDLATPPTEKFLRGLLLTSPRKFILLTSLIVIPIFGNLAFFFYSRSYLFLSIICGTPVAILLGQILRMIILKPDSHRDEIERDAFRAMVDKILPQIEHEDTIDKN